MHVKKKTDLESLDICEDHSFGIVLLRSVLGLSMGPPVVFSQDISASLFSSCLFPEESHQHFVHGEIFGH